MFLHLDIEVLIKLKNMEMYLGILFMREIDVLGTVFQLGLLAYVYYWVFLLLNTSNAIRVGTKVNNILIQRVWKIE